MTSKFILRDYQEECVAKIVDSAKTKQIFKQVVVLATGLGKTVIFGHLPSLVKKKGKKTLILAHRGELLDQAKEKLEQIDPDLKVEIEQASRKVENYVDVVVASVQTIGRKGSKRIEKFNPDDFGLIVVDECHHATAETYRNIFRHFQVLKDEENVKPNGKVLLGVTATPNRADHVGLDSVFDEIVYSYTLKDGIYNGYLANIKAFTVSTKTDISKVATRMGDFADKELGDKINNPERNKLVVDTYKEKFDNTKALVFASTVEHAKQLTEFFNKAGRRAEYVIGATDKTERERILDEFKNGELNIVVNCMVLTEGYDNPNIQTILMTRPTKSSVAYSQMIGRGTRLAEHKDSLNLVDFVDNVGNNRVITLPSLFGIPKTLKGKGKLITELVEKTEKLLEVNPATDVESIEDWSDENIEKIVKQVNILSQAELPTEVKEYSNFSWEKFDEEYKIHIPPQDDERHIITISKNMLSKWEVNLETFKKEKPSYKNGYSAWGKPKKQLLDAKPEIDTAFKSGDGYIKNNFKNVATMFHQDSAWRGEEPSEKQLNMLKKFNVPIPAGITKGQASVLLSREFAKRNNNRGRRNFYYGGRKKSKI